MAVAWLGFTPSLPHGNLLRTALVGLENGLDGLNEIIATMTMMVTDGNPNVVANFDIINAKFGFASQQAAHDAYFELLSLAGKLNTNASVSDVNAALLQAFSKFRSS